MKEVNGKNIVLSWIEKTYDDNERVGAMYCFKRCDINEL